MSYQQFVRYVDRYLADVPHGTAPDGRPPHQSAVGAAPQTGPALSPRLVPPTPPPALPVAAPTAPQPEGGLPRFTYNPGLSPRDKLV